MTKPFVAISLGWGVQSFGLAAMSALGELPPVDVAIHADTTHERTATYEFAAKWTPWLEDHGVRVVTVKPPKADVVRTWTKSRGVMIPAFTLDGKKKGQVRRQCTAEWKIDPIKRWLQANRHGQHVEQWIGISLDEIARMKPSNVGYIVHRWPLIEREMTRQQVRAWLVDRGLELPPRSACYFCPFQSRDEWRSVQGTPDWDRAIQVDEAIRNGTLARKPMPLFLHASRIPLAQVDFRSEQERGQMDLWEADGHDNECTGSCFL